MSKHKFRRPQFLFKEKLYILCEGIADKIFLDKMFKQLNLKYDVDVKQCKSKDKIFNAYRKFKSIYSEIDILVFIDLDGLGSKNIDNLNLEFINNGYEKPDIYFVNPVIEYFFILPKANKNSMYTKKVDYKMDIKKFYCIENYDGTKKECESIVNSISSKDWEDFLIRVNRCKHEVEEIPSSNIYLLIEKIISIEENES